MYFKRPDLKHPFTFFLLMSLLCVTSCREADPEERTFDNFQEEFGYLVERYVRMGAAIGIVDKDGLSSEYYFGHISKTRPEAPGPHSLFEIGSITKTFTALLLAVMVNDGRISLEDEAMQYLPLDEVKLPEREGRKITIRELVTHSSGLPRSPRESSQPKPADYNGNDPYAAYSTEVVYDYLTNYCTLLFEPGTAYHYSNTGMGLLGHILGRIDSSSYSELLQREILDPLGMEETTLFLDEWRIQDLAPGHNSSLDSAWNYNAQDVFQGAGFIKSSLTDMLVYLQVQMGIKENPLSEEIGMTQVRLFDVGGVPYNDREGYYHLGLGMAWHIDSLPEGQVFYQHGGRTNGYMAYMGFDREMGTGVVILCNQSWKEMIIRFGEDLLKAVNRY